MRKRFFLPYHIFSWLSLWKFSFFIPLHNFLAFQWLSGAADSAPSFTSNPRRWWWSHIGKRRRREGNGNILEIFNFRAWVWLKCLCSLGKVDGNPWLCEQSSRNSFKNWIFYCRKCQVCLKSHGTSSVSFQRWLNKLKFILHCISACIYCSPAFLSQYSFNRCR